MPPDADRLSRRLRHQAAWCAELGSPLYSSLLEAAADDLETGGPMIDVLSGFEEESGAAALALRLMGAVHRLVLEDDLPELAERYPSTGGDGDATAAWPVFRDALTAHRERIRALLASGCQTNEVGRSAALLGGFLEVAHRSITICHLGNIAMRLGREKLKWDPEKEQILDDAEAARMLSRPYREPWKLS